MKLYEKEIITDIKGYEGLYKITSFGRVWSCGRDKTRYKTGFFKKLTIAKNGYVFVGLNKNKKLKTVKTSRLVAEAFIEKEAYKTEVNHIDGNKLNNSVDNLEWCTRSENMKHAYAIGLKKHTNAHIQKATIHCRELGKVSGKLYGRENGKKTKKLTLSQDKEIRDKYKKGATIKSLQLEYGVSNTPIIRAIRNNYAM